MTHPNAHSFIFTLGWTRFSVSGYVGMEKRGA